MTRATRVVAGALLLLTIAAPAVAQGRGQAHKKQRAVPPSRNDLAAPATTAVTPATGGATPFAWIDDGSVIDPGAVAVAISFLQWQGAGLSELDVPVVDVVAGLAPRAHVSVTVPRVSGSGDPFGAAGGLGTSYFSLKLGILDGNTSGVRLAVSPTLEVLSGSVAEAFTTDGRRAHFGVPISAEIDRGRARLYGSTGYFSRGLWFAGGGLGVLAVEKVMVSAAFSRAWRRADAAGAPLNARVRNEISGGASYAVTPAMSMFGSVGRTIATLDENGAGTTIGGGVAWLFAKSTP